MDQSDNRLMPSLEPPIDELSSFSSNIPLNENYENTATIKRSPGKGVSKSKRKG